MVLLVCLFKICQFSVSNVQVIAKIMIEFVFSLKIKGITPLQVRGVRVERGNFVMDAPARALVLNIKTGGFDACHKCWVKGSRC